MEKKFPSQLQDKFTVRFPEGMRDKIAELADKNGRSMNAEIVFILNQFIEDREKISAFSKKTYTELFSKIINIEDELFRDDVAQYIDATSDLAQAMSFPAQRSFIKEFMVKHKNELEEKLKELDKK